MNTDISVSLIRSLSCTLKSYVKLLRQKEPGGTGLSASWLPDNILAHRTY